MDLIIGAVAGAVGALVVEHGVAWTVAYFKGRAAAVEATVQKDSAAVKAVIAPVSAAAAAVAPPAAPAAPK